MPLDEATHRFAFLMQRDLRKLTDRERDQERRGESISYDTVSRVATFETRGGEVTGRHYGAMLATYNPDERIFRWAWTASAKTNTGFATHAENIFREGQSRGVPQLAMSVINDISVEEALTLAQLGALVARANALHVRAAEDAFEYVGLFDRPRPTESIADDSRFSVPPLRTSQKMPPIREVWEPRNSSSPPPAGVAPKIREPARALFLPVANLALASLASSVPGFQQALLVTTIEGDRVDVQLVALDAMGILRALEPRAELLAEAQRMVDDDRKEGNTAWRRLSARITPKQDGGATLAVDVV